VTFAYGAANRRTPALAGVSLQVEGGEIVAVLGANGSGKSTLVRLANGMLRPAHGRITVDGVATVDGNPRALRGSESGGVGHRDERQIRELVGVVFQHPDEQIVATAVEDDVAFGPENLGLPRAEIRRRVDESLNVVGLEGLERREPHLLSGGQKQRLVIAGALAMRPRYLVLDEPTSMLDPQGRSEVLSVIARLRNDGRGILLVTHDLAEAARADRVLVLHGGSVAFEGTPEELFEDARLGEWGLELPPVAHLVRALAAAGVPVDAATVDPVELAGVLCR
jgi:energy-coupling factor transporter ATPase